MELLRGDKRQLIYFPVVPFAEAICISYRLLRPINRARNVMKCARVGRVCDSFLFLLIEKETKRSRKTNARPNGSSGQASCCFPANAHENPVVVVISLVIARESWKDCIVLSATSAGAVFRLVVFKVDDLFWKAGTRRLKFFLV